MGQPTVGPHGHVCWEMVILAKLFLWIALNLNQLSILTEVRSNKPSFNCLVSVLQQLWRDFWHIEQINPVCRKEHLTHYPNSCKVLLVFGLIGAGVLGGVVWWMSGLTAAEVALVLHFNKCQPRAAVGMDCVAVWIVSGYFVGGVSLNPAVNYYVLKKQEQDNPYPLHNTHHQVSHCDTSWFSLPSHASP